MPSRPNDACGIDPEQPAQRRSRIAAAKAIGPQRHEGTSLRQESAHAFRYCSHVISGGNDRCGAGTELLCDERCPDITAASFCAEIGSFAGLAVASELAPAG